MNTIRAAVLVALAVTGVSCNDLRVGVSHGRIVFNETIQASPAVWRQSQQITVNVTDQEIITSVEVTDNRADKDGEAKIIEGGEGKQNVTIELKSPTIFRGFDFHIVAYAAQGSVQHPLVDAQHPLNDAQHPSNAQTPVNDAQRPFNDVQHPAVMTKDIDLNTSAKPENQDFVTVATEVTDGSTPPAFTGDLPRKSRNTQQPDPIVKFVTEKADHVNQQSTTEVTQNTEKLATEVTDAGLKGQESIVPVGSIVPATFPKIDLTTEDNKAQAKGQAFSTDLPLKDFDVKILSTSTGVPDVTSTTTEKTHEKMVQQNFDSISKELGQKVVFGIRKH